MSTIFEIVCIFSLFITIGNALTCFKCDKIPFPRDCKTVIKCGANEECFVERIITDDGNVYFNTGCKDKQRCVVGGKRSAEDKEVNLDQASNSMLKQRQASFETIICDSCCTDDHCNYGGCGADPLPAADKRGPICYSCEQMQDPTLCNQVTLCGRDQMCEVLKTPHPTFDVTYTTKCGTKALCDRLMGSGNIFGRSAEERHLAEKRSSLCFRCCKGDLCNLGCTNPTTVSTTVATTTPVSQTSAQTTTLASSTSSSSTNQMSTNPQTSGSQTTSGSSSSTSNANTTSSVMSTTPMMSTTPHPTFATNASNHGCLPDYVFYGSSCYYFSTSSLYWAPARKFCKDHGSDLAIINDATEDNLMIQHLKQLTAQHLLPSDLWAFYIGAHLVNGTWKWVDNTDLTYTNWATNEPDKPATQMYGAIFVPSSGYYNYQWASHKDMYTTSYFICEFKPSP